MTDFVLITHPEAGEALVPASAVPHWRSSGWSPVEETPAADAAPKTRASKGDK